MNSPLRSHPALRTWLTSGGATLFLALTLAGCVSPTAYEQATSAIEVEREGHRRAVAQLEAQEQKLAQAAEEKKRLLAHTAELKSKVEKEERELAQARLEVVTTEKAHEQEAQLVTHLRGELARVGAHLKSYAGDKDALSAQLEATRAELAIKEQRLAALEAEVAGLHANLSTTEEKSERTHAELNGALSQLAELEQALDGPHAPSSEGTSPAGAKEPAEPSHAEEPAASDADRNHPAPPPESTAPRRDAQRAPVTEHSADADNQEREDESIYEPVEEVSPSEEVAP